MFDPEIHGKGSREHLAAVIEGYNEVLATIVSDPVAFALNPDEQAIVGLTVLESQAMLHDHGLCSCPVAEWDDADLGWLAYEGIDPGE